MLSTGRKSAITLPMQCLKRKTDSFNILKKQENRIDFPAFFGSYLTDFENLLGESTREYFRVFSLEYQRLYFRAY